MTEISFGSLTLTIDALLIDGSARISELAHEISDGIHRLTLKTPAFPSQHSITLRLRVTGAERFLRNGYHSWDGSWFVETAALADAKSDGAERTGFAVTALPRADGGVVIIGFERHDRFQSRLGFASEGDTLTMTAETLTDETGATTGETLLMFEDIDVETGLRRWSQLVADASPIPPRRPDKRITGWCSWYNLYAQISPANLREHLASARDFRDQHQVPLDLFLIDDGFTPEMGDWLDFKPGFADGLKPLVRDIAAAGFTPALWIAPFLVGNRSKLFAEHPDWVVGDRETSGPLVAMTYYGEFRWHKRSEEYYVLDVTHPEAAAHIARVFRTWAHDWGAKAFKTDFMYFGMEFGHDRARWHTPGLSRVAVWRKMAAIIRHEIGDDAIWLGCGAPLWASVGYFDANRIGRDVGVDWTGSEQSAESLLRDQVSRNHAHGILWQGDPDCVLLRDRFHRLSNSQIEGLAYLAANSGGVLMTSDNLGDLSPRRQALFAALLKAKASQCHFPELGRASDGKITQTATVDGNHVTLKLDVISGNYNLS
jgi:alpha-galactosidase